MSLSLDDNSSHYMIRSYESGCIYINDQRLTQNVLVYPNKLDVEQLPGSIEELALFHLKRVYNERITILLIGTGANLKFPAIDVYAELLTKGIGVEIMGTRAACRTFQVLSSEERAVAALLFL